MTNLVKPRIWLFVVLMIGQFAVFEIGLRVKGGSEAAPAFQRLFMDDSRIGYRLRPGARTVYKTASFETSIAINSSGTRDDEIGPKAPNERRIVVLGDSLVLSVQVPLEQTFCKRLEQRLNENRALAPYHYRVINAGVQGYGPVEELLFYEHVASAFDADVVLMALFVGNDAVEAADSASRVIAADGASATAASIVRPLTIRQRLTRFVRRVVRRSMVLQIVRLRAQMLIDRLGYRALPPIERPLTSYLAAPPPDVLTGLRVTRQCVLRVAEIASTRGAKTGIVLLPARLQVNDEDFGYLKSWVEQHGQTMMRNGATERFKGALADVRLPMIDVLPALLAVPRPSETFFEDTIHLTPRGHQVVADALEQFLVESGLLAVPDLRQASGSGR